MDMVKKTLSEIQIKLDELKMSRQVIKSCEKRIKNVVKVSSKAAEMANKLSGQLETLELYLEDLESYLDEEASSIDDEILASKDELRDEKLATQKVKSDASINKPVKIGNPIVGKGKPKKQPVKTLDVPEKTVKQLHSEAKALGISGFSRMSKVSLQMAIDARRKMAIDTRRKLREGKSKY